MRKNFKNTYLFYCCFLIYPHTFDAQKIESPLGKYLINVSTRRPMFVMTGTGGTDSVMAHYILTKKYFLPIDFLLNKPRSNEEIGLKNEDFVFTSRGHGLNIDY